VGSSVAASAGSLTPDRVLLKVAVLFIAIYALMQALVWFLALRGWFDPVMESLATFTGACSVATGLSATVTGNEVILANRILRIDLDCTGITLMMLYSALVLAYPLSVKRKAMWIAIGLPVLILANLLRLIAVAQLSAPLGNDAFLFVHDYLFKVAMIAVVIVLWSLFLTSARRHAP